VCYEQKAQAGNKVENHTSSPSTFLESDERKPLAPYCTALIGPTETALTKTPRYITSGLKFFKLNFAAVSFDILCV
jgi:hypothetical protein